MWSYVDLCVPGGASGKRQRREGERERTRTYKYTQARHEKERKILSSVLRQQNGKGEREGMVRIAVPVALLLEIVEEQGEEKRSIK
jgi:hypothetical protein